MWRGRHGGLDKKIAAKGVFWSGHFFFIFIEILNDMFLEYFDNMPNIDEDGP